MVSLPRNASLLFVWGLSVLLGGGVLYYPGDALGIAGGLRWLTLSVAVVIGGGLLWHSVSSWQGGGDDLRQNQRPAIVLGLVGLLAVVGSVSVIRPWAYSGLARGVGMIGLAAFLVVGGLVIATGVYCHRTQNQRVPLTIFAGLTGAGVFYPLDASGVTLGLHPLLWVAVVVLFVGGPALVVYYRWPRIRDSDSSSDGSSVCDTGVEKGG